MIIRRHSVMQWIQNEYIDVAIKNIVGPVKVHWHEFYEIELILDGSGTYSIDDIDYPIQAGSMFIMSPISFHRPVFTANTRLINFMFTMDACDLECLSAVFSNRPHIALQVSPEDQQFFHVLASDLVNRIRNPVNTFAQYQSLVLNCILGKIGTLCAAGSVAVGGSALQHAILYIQNHFTENILLEDAAKIANYSPNYFSDKFKGYTGKTFKRYVIDMRLSFAKNLLQNTKLPVSQVVYRCGFGDFSNFMSTFKKRYGVTPKAFRSAQNEDDSGSVTSET